MKIALVSLDQCWHNKDANFSRCEILVQRAKASGCDLVVFPEMTLTGYSLIMPEIAEFENNSSTMQRFGRLAKKTGTSIIFGACLRDYENTKPRNSFCFAVESGEVQVLYSKIHLFSFVGEHEVMEAGRQLGVTQHGNLRFGASICYDLRFPEIYAAMAKKCDAVFTIANWPKARVSHWKILLTARAIENQCFMFGVNRIGTDGNGLKYEKSSIAIAPDGELIVPIISEVELDIYDIDLKKVIAYRSSFHTLQDKQYALYSDLLGKIR